MPANRVLIIDDSHLLLGMARQALESAGFVVATAETLSDFDREREAQTPDLILIDVNMPEAFGDDLAMVLRVAHGVSVPIYLYSDLEETDLGRRAKDADVDGYISKRSGIPAMVERVRSLLGQTARSEADELRQMFMPRFVKVAGERFGRCRAVLAAGVEGNLSSLTIDLHSLAGEAAALGLTDLANLARVAEKAARAWAESASDADRAACSREVDVLGAAIGSL